MLRKFYTFNNTRNIGLLARVWSGTNGASAVKYTEQQLKQRLEMRFPEANKIQVEDVSGGCGAMYEIYVESYTFQGLSTIKQHRLITDTLKTEIRDMHGLRIFTSIPKSKTAEN